MGKDGTRGLRLAPGIGGLHPRGCCPWQAKTEHSRQSRTLSCGAAGRGLPPCPTEPDRRRRVPRSRIARARTEAPVHGVSPATAHMPRIVHTIRPRSHHRRSVPAAPLDKTANLLEHCRTNARRRETVNRYGALRAHRRPLDLDQGRCRHRAARGRRNPRTGEAVSIPARTAPPFKAGKTLCGRLDGQHGERAVRWHPFGREPQPGRPRFFATHPPRRDAPDSPLPSRILRHRRPSRSHAHCATAITLPPPSGCRLPPGRGTFVAGR